MPTIWINDKDLHKLLKSKLPYLDGLTIGEAVELYIEFGLNAKLAEMSEDQRQRLSNLIGSKGVEILEKSK